jgi:hypothetical protein
VATPQAAAPKAEKIRRAPKPPAPKAFNRWTVLGDALLQKKTGTLDEITALANQIYVEKGGKDNIRESSAVTKACFQLLAQMEVISVTGNDYVVN